MPSVARVEPLTTARALRGPFDYTCPPGAGKGAIVEVSFARRRMLGVVTALAEHSEHDLQDPIRVLGDSVPADLVDLALWLADEYCSTPARALALVLPPRGARVKTAFHATAIAAIPADTRLSERQRALLVSLPRLAGVDLAALRRLEGRGLVEITVRAVRRRPAAATVGSTAAPATLTAEQQAAVERIAQALPGEQLLLHGVTGSGKTEVYLQATAAVLARGAGVIILVPEIGLTPQTIGRFAARFGDTVAVLHSGLSDGERYDEWRRLRSGEARVAVGPRSAVFAPIAGLGLVVVDEEHDGSYKNESDPRYDARLVAARRGAVLVCGSATPRPESVHGLERVRLHRRVDGAALPPVEAVSLLEADGALHPHTHAALVDSRKAIVLLNRRGWSNFLTCGSCGRVWMCGACDVALVLHAAAQVVACHHCGHSERVPTRCPACSSVSIARHGTGTERLAADLERLGRPVLRLDGEVRRPADVLAAFAGAPTAILVGTQVVAKGHDFPDVDLGVVVDADATLRFPDFRAEERTFALVTQLAGRAGRGGDGRVIVQTLDPRAASIAHAVRHDADGFTAGELERRRALRYPPFATLIRVVCSSPAPAAALAAATAVRERLEGAGAVLGPAPLFRLRGRERAQVVVKADDRAAAIAITGAAVAAVARIRAHKVANLSVDVDPR